MLAVADDYDPAETLALNREFHFQIFSLSPNSIMVDGLGRLWRLAQPYMATRMVAPESQRKRVEEHADIIDRMTGRDSSQRCAAIAKAHARYTALPRRSSLRTSTPWAPNNSAHRQFTVFPARRRDDST
jgi:DNA-binding GntR family transcriptional regulator